MLEFCQAYKSKLHWRLLCAQRQSKEGKFRALTVPGGGGVREALSRSRIYQTAKRSRACLAFAAERTIATRLSAVMIMMAAMMSLMMMMVMEKLFEDDADDREEEMATVMT